MRKQIMMIKAQNKHSIILKGGEITDEKKFEIMENMNAIDDAQTGGLAVYTRAADSAEAKIN